jgi:hypothetical protein
MHEAAHEADSGAADQEQENEDVERSHALALAASFRHCEASQRPWQSRLDCFPRIKSGVALTEF